MIARFSRARRSAPAPAEPNRPRQRSGRIPALGLLALLAALLVGLLVGLGGCQSGPRDFENENDRLRRLTSELRDRVDVLSERVETLKRELAAARRAATAEVPEGVRRPTVRRIELAGYSGGIDTDKDGADDALRLYLRTLDERNRFVQAMGRVEITAAAIPAGEEARTVATASFDAAALDEAYRSGFGGTHYTLVVPVTKDVPQAVEQLTVSLSYKNLLNDERLTLKKAVRWSGARSDGSGASGPEAAPRTDQKNRPAASDPSAQ